MTVVDRFLKYVSFETTSCEASTTVPSSEKELVLAEYLKNELEKIGLFRVSLSKEGYVYGFIPSNLKRGEKAPSIGFIAHMDTSDGASGKDVKPKQIKKNGQRFIVTDGTTLLGADDKAGIAEIVSFAEYLLAHPEIKHGKICVCFTPDEEIGRGTDYFDLKKFGADFAYTVDGGELGEIEYESFNAANAKIVFNGKNVHPGSAKGIMKNSLLMANDFINLLPAGEDPAHTEGYEGYFHVQSITGDETTTKLAMLIRDHDMKKFKARKKLVEDAVAFINKKWGAGSAVLDMPDAYYNMKEVLKNHMYVVDRAKAAMKDCGVEVKEIAIRGGTDGCRLSFEGLLCPNLSTGGGNFHSVDEYVSIDAMEKMVEVLVRIAEVK